MNKPAAILSLLFFHQLSFGQLIDNYETVPSSENAMQKLVAKTNLFNLQFPQTKIYLHLDRPSYWANDDIWFKAYVKNTPINNCNLYVELINSAGQVINKNIAWVQNGLAYGDIHIANTLSSGLYQIRAYTNWMRNFDDTWFFRKELIILNPRDKEVKADIKELKRNDVDLQFFPEGGTFVSGVENKVAFKATDQNGKGIDLEGIIYDESGNQVVEIKSRYKGIGSFVFQPEDGIKYIAEVHFNGNIFKKVDLPMPNKEGIVFKIDALDSSKINIQVINVSGSSNSNYFIVGQSGQNICYQKEITELGKNNYQVIEKKSLPEGIIRFTLFNFDMQPVCERLVFNNLRDAVDLVIKTEKKDYLPREKIKLEIEAHTKDEYPEICNLSMSVYNTNSQLMEEDFSSNIYSHFLLNSELKGNIENSAWYFKDDSLSTLIALDNLMLTHGYRYFEWKEIFEDKFPEIVFQPQPSIELKGKVVSYSLGRPIENAKLTMMTRNSLLAVYETKTDSMGQFIFSDLYFYDTIYVSIQALNKKGNRTTVIEIDSSSSTSPSVNYIPSLYEYKRAEPIPTIAYLNETKSDLIRKKSRLSDTILLNEVNVAAPKIKKGDAYVRTYFTADLVVDMKKQTEGPYSIVEYVESKIPGLYMQDGNYYARGEELLVYLNGVPDINNAHKDLSFEDFDKIEYVKYGLFAGVNYHGGILFFYTTRGKKNAKTKLKSFGMESAQIIGYSVTRKFYSPKYESNKQPEKKEDFRNTIYWNPVVMTDNNGIGQIEFYNSDETGEIKIVVEGVTKDGKLCRGLANYTVKY